MRNQGLGSWPARRARKTPDRVAVVYGDREWTYRQLHERVLRWAAALRGLGVRRGDRVAYLGPNHPAFLETLFAAGVLGAVFVPLNTRLAGPEIDYQVADSGATVLVHAMPSDSPVPHRVAVGAQYEELLAAAGPEPRDEVVAPDDLCMIMYTSGTTGRPKGAALTHGNITWNSVNVLVDVDLAGDEVTLVVAPMFHTAGLNMTCLPTLLKGGRVVLVPSFDPEAVLALIEERRVTYLFGVPTMYQAMAASPRFAGTDLSSVRALNCGGAPVPEATLRTWLERGLAFSQGYGMTEASPGALYLDQRMAAAKAGTAGVPHFFTDVRVVRPDRTEVAPGEKGEVLVSGPNVMAGYWGRPADTEAVLADGWFRTGDVAVVDGDGYVSLVDRLKDVIISGGENVYPAEVEAAVLAHPAVTDCAVIGVPDERWGEVGRAVLRLRAGADRERVADELPEFLAERLARYKIPKSVVFADELPRTPTGKLLRSLLRSRYGHHEEDATP
jgi:acyl-CoA synthetase (AMP-forming)/AMP-acid ligase II